MGGCADTRRPPMLGLMIDVAIVIMMVLPGGVIKKIT